MEMTQAPAADQDLDRVQDQIVEVDVTPVVPQPKPNRKQKKEKSVGATIAMTPPKSLCLTKIGSQTSSKLKKKHLN